MPPEFPFGDWRAAAASLRRAARRSPLVARQLERSGTTARTVTAEPAAWRLLDPLTKEDVLADQRLDPPFGSRRAAPVSEIGLVVESSGTSGRGREVHYVARKDVRRSAREWAGYLAEMGIGADDTVALTLPVGMAGGGVRHMYAYSELGAKVLRMGNLSSVQKLEAIRYYRASVLVATPAYVDRLARVAEEQGLRPGDLGVERIAVATQAVSPDWVRTTEETWGARLYEWYGTSAGIAAFACRHGMLDPGGGRGTLHWDPAHAVQEVVDPASGEWVGDGERGEMVGSPLRNEAEPLFRFRTGDAVRFRAPGACACGSPWPGIESGTVGRLDAMFKVRGVNVWPVEVEATLLQLADVLDYRVCIRQDEQARERLELEVLARRGSAQRLARAVPAALHEDVGLSFDVAVLEDSGSWSQETGGEAGKARRWRDLRAGAG